MRETQAQIKKYQARLPHMREKLAMVAMLFVISAVMLTSATFAWFVLSKNPEIKGISTSVTSNGNLEIALSDLDGMEPENSKVGDSSAAGTAIKDANLTWGNLVNLSDGYGLDSLTLRPATLNTSGLQSGSPLWGATYGRDGRIEKLKSDFAYTIWQEAKDGQAAAFVVPNGNAFGVRAISSVVYTNLSGDTTFKELVDTAEEKNALAGDAYIAITNTPEYMSSITSLMGEYLTYRLNGGSSPDCSPYVEPFYLMMVDFYEAMKLAGDSLVYLANTQQFLKVGSGYVPYTRETLLKATSKQLQDAGVDLESLQQYKSDLTQLEKDLVTMETYYISVRDNNATVTWSQLNGIVNRLVDIDSCTVDGKAVSKIGASDAGSFLGSGTHEAIIHKGFLYNMEKLTGSNMYAKDLTVKVKYYTTVTLKANVYTNLKDSGTSTFYNDLNAIKEANKGSYVGGDAVAQDTYGMALDIWVRTNAEASYLTLSGNVVTKEIEEKATAKVGNETVDLYTYPIRDTDNEGNIIDYNIDVYQKDGKWYDYQTGEEIEVTSTPKQKINIITEILDYQGENRVWEENGLLTEESTTQGSGSCYIYYADTPEDSARSLELLKSMKVAFISANNTLLATATMDTDNYYAVSGKYTVPLVVEQTNYTTMDEFGGTIKAIMPLVQGQATRITAILYLDGGTLTNDEVLTASDIQGTLNLQFGSSVPLDTMGDRVLEEAIVTVSATASDTSFNYDTDKDLSTTVTVNVAGFEPKLVEAQFQRAINGTQGTRMEKFTFSSSGTAGEWSGNYTFGAPGNYILRYVRLDGVEYELQTPINVTVTGFNLTSLTCDKDKIMTANRSASANLSLTFAADDVEKMPKTVQGRFMKEDGTSTTITFERNTTTNIWSGTANFVSSGTYTLEYLVLDGDYTEIPKEYQKVVEASLGMKTRVYISRTGDDPSLTFKFYGGTETLNVSAIIMDDANKEKAELTNVKLYYGKGGSVLQESGMNADLTWNPQTGFYEGQFLLSGAGIYNFSSLIVGSNVITAATNAPTVRAQSPEPPQYMGAVDLIDYQFAPNNDAKMTVQVAYSSSASAMKAVFIKDGITSKTYTVDCAMGTESTIDGKPVNKWIMTLPTDGGTQDGTWTLTELHVAGVYDKAGNEYTEDTPMVLTVSDKPEVKVVSTVIVRFAEDKSQQFGGTAANVTGHFMDAYEVSNLDVYIEDKQGNALPNVENVTLTYSRKPNTESEYGNYTASHLNGTSDGEILTVNLVADSENGAHFVQENAVIFQIAGLYETSFSFKVNGTTYSYGGDSGKSLPANTPAFTVRSMKPTLTVTGTNPAPTETFSINIATDSSRDTTILNGVKNYYSDYMANVYIKSSSSGSYTLPKVTMKLTNAGSAFTKASVVVVNGESSDYNRTYSYTADNTTNTQEIGGTQWMLIATNRFLAGKQTLKTIDMVCGGNTYSVTLSNAVVINQQHNPPYLTFAGVDTNYNAVPANIVSPDGNSMKVTLPTMNNWILEEVNESGGNGEVDAGSNTFTVSTSYTEGSGCNKKTLYNYYTRTVRTTNETTLKETWKVTYGITGWKIGSTTYKPGATVTVTSGQTATAVVGVISREKVSSVEAVYVREYTMDVAGETAQGSASGSVVSQTYADETLTDQYWKD